MHTHTFSYSRETGWSIEEFPAVDSPQTLIFVFVAPEYFDDPSPIEELLRHYPQSHVQGCSTSGEILGTSLSDLSISVAIAKFESTQLKTAYASVADHQDSHSAAQWISEQLASDDLQSIFVLADGLQINGSDLVRGFSRHLPPKVTVSGGLAGDGHRFDRTFVLQNASPTEGLISAVGFYGNKLVIGHGSRGGWDKFGHERLITRSKGNVLYELDGKPALDIYKKYVGADAPNLLTSALFFPLSVREAQDHDKSLVRTILALDESANTVTFAGEVPQGHVAQFLFANMDRIIDGAGQAATLALTGPDEVLAVGVSCVGRRLILSDRAEEELEAVLDVLPSESQVVGFYSYGEICPYSDGCCDLHNESMTVTTFREAA